MTDINAVSAALGGLGIENTINEPMRLHTSFRIGGSADIFAKVTSREQLFALLAFAKENDIPLMLVGNGSNLLVSDNGIGGIVARLEGEFIEITPLDGGLLRAGAGASLSAFCKAALDNSLSGMEFAYGIPGSVGGAAFMNAGAYGGEMKDIIVSCEYITRGGESGELSGEECDFVYRGSIFQREPYIVTAVTVRLQPGDPTAIKAAMDDVMGRRKAKQPLELPSAGSVFKRPEGHFAGGLIEQCGLKGRCVGGAQVSKKHAGFIVNRGEATCSDVLGLVKLIQDTVLAETGVELECEIRMTGR